MASFVDTRQSVIFTHTHFGLTYKKRRLSLSTIFHMTNKTKVAQFYSYIDTFKKKKTKKNCVMRRLIWDYILTEGNVCIWLLLFTTLLLYATNTLANYLHAIIFRRNWHIMRRISNSRFGPVLKYITCAFTTVDFKKSCSIYLNWLVLEIRYDIHIYIF